ncbi:hypothetical protein NKJ55_28360 [Mesorhizobium sp. M0106]|uniref:hypothetical protein n=1 Tax=Mesorhizobium sp. M0106 TaxID=2956880 RepID=UPI003339C510
MDTKGEEDDTRILSAVKRIAPTSLIPDIARERPMEAQEDSPEPYQPGPLPFWEAAEEALSEREQAIAEYDPMEAMRRDHLGLTDETGGLLP